MEINVKKSLHTIAVCLFLYTLGFCTGYFFDRIRTSIHPAGAGADVSGYDAASERVERAADEIRNAAGNVREAAGEVKISINEAGSIGEIARDIGSGTDRALNGVGSLADGVQRIMGIMDAAEKRNAKMEADSGIGMD